MYPRMGGDVICRVVMPGSEAGRLSFVMIHLRAGAQYHDRRLPTPQSEQKQQQPDDAPWQRLPHRGRVSAPIRGVKPCIQPAGHGLR